MWNALKIIFSLIFLAFDVACINKYNAFAVDMNDDCFMSRLNMRDLLLNLF